MADEKIRVGIIGANAGRGWGSGAHIPAILALPEYELTAVCTAHQETSEESARTFGARMAFHDHEEMVNHPEVDLVTVAVRVPYHLELTSAALNAGKHVYTEWSLGVTLEGTRQLADLARSKDVRTMVGLQGRCSPALLYMRELVEGGYVGDVLSCHLSSFNATGLDRTSDRVWAKDQSSGVGTLNIQFGHYVDALCLAVGEVQEVSGVVSTRVKEWYFTDLEETMEVTTPDNVLVSGRLGNGGVVSVHVAAIPWHSSDGPSMQVFGRDGTLVYHGSHIDYSRLEGARGNESALQEIPVPDRLVWVPADVPQGPPFNVAQMYRRLAGAIRTGGPVEPDFDFAVRRRELLESIQVASDQGRAQSVASAGSQWARVTGDW